MNQYEGWCEIMASSKEYLHFILEQLSDLDGISYRSMMGEYILYYRGKIVGGVYDDRLLVKKTRSALECIENIPFLRPHKTLPLFTLLVVITRRE